MNFLELLEKETNVKETENGALGYKTTDNALVDFNFNIASYRNPRRYKDIIPDFVKAWAENDEIALKYLFYMRDVREGLGERNTFRVILKELAPKLDVRVFDWIMEYGRADDLFVFFDTCLEKEMLEFVQNQLTNDMINCTNEKPCSLLAKWMPSINTSSKETRKLAEKFIKAYGLEPKTYRKTLAKLRNYIDVLEKKLCANKWNEVDYNTVPSNANLKYKDAFLKHDTERRKEYLSSLAKGDKDVKINSSVLYPHDIVAKYTLANDWYDKSLKDYDEALEQMWKNLPNYVNDAQNVMVVRDGSGSMYSPIGNTNLEAIDVADALSIYFSERCSYPYKDKFITFSHSPEFVNLSKNQNLHDKLRELHRYNDCSNTDVKAVFDLVLKVAKEHNLEQKDIPTLLIISDMEFDGAVDHASKRLFEVIAQKYNEAGYQLPKCVFWNVNSRTGTIPLTQNDRGVILVSGFSTTIAKMVLSNKTDPYEALLEQLMSKRYEKITLKK